MKIGLLLQIIGMPPATAGGILPIPYTGKKGETSLNWADNFKLRINQIRNLLTNTGYGAVTIDLQSNFSFITRGRSFIGLASVASCGCLVITADKIGLIAENIEANRLFKEQLHSSALVDVYEYPWDQGGQKSALIHAIAEGKRIADETLLSGDLLMLRSQLTSYDIANYRSLCYDTAFLLESVCKRICAGVSDYELAGELSQVFWRANIEPITLLIAFDERARLYRHPLPIGAHLKNYAVLSVCTRRNGLIASVTRCVAIEMDDKLWERNRKCAAVWHTILSRLTPGASLKSIFGAITQSYAQQGYENEECYHHQGGLTGFVPREIRIDAKTDHKVRENEAYAFNPTIQGAKCEETLLITSKGIETMTHTGEYTYESALVHGKPVLIPVMHVLNA